MNNTKLFTIHIVEYKGKHKSNNFVVYAELFDNAWNRFWKCIDTLDEEDCKYIGCKAEYFLHITSKHIVCHRKIDADSNITAINILDTIVDDNGVAYIGGGYEYN